MTDDRTGERMAFRPSEVARALGLSERTIRSMLARGELRHVRIGRRVLISADTVRELLRDATPAR